MALRYSINLSLDGFYDHHGVSLDAESHQYATELLAQAYALIFQLGNDSRLNHGNILVSIANAMGIDISRSHGFMRLQCELCRKEGSPCLTHQAFLINLA